MLDKLLLLEAKTAILNTNDLRVELEEYIELESNFNEVEKFVFYQSWFKYLLHQQQYTKATMLLEQMNILYTQLPIAYKHLINNLRINRLRLNVYTNVFVDETENILKQLLQTRLTKLNFLSIMYLLGILSLNKEDLKTAKTRFEYVVENGKQIFIVEEAKSYLYEINLKENVETEIE